jgi:hypothetical protein
MNGEASDVSHQEDRDLARGIPVHHLEDAADDSLKRALEAVDVAGVKPRLRVAVAVWNGQQYLAWRGQSWRLDVDGEKGAKDVKEALELFFDSVALVGAVETARKLKR